MARRVRAMRFAAVAIATLLSTAALGTAQAPLPAAADAAGPLPSYARPIGEARETIHGEIIAVRGAFHITVRDDRGFIDEVDLQPGTVIEPVGVQLSVGMTVTIEGYNAGATFAATSIETPYQYDGAAPNAEYYGEGWWYPGYAWGYGPSFTLGYIGYNYLVPQPYTRPGAPVVSHERGFEHPTPVHHAFRSNTVNPVYPPPSAGISSTSPPSGAREIPHLRAQPAPGEARAWSAPAYRAPDVRSAPAYRAPEVRSAPAYRAPEVRSAPAYRAPEVRSEPARSAPAPARAPK